MGKKKLDISLIQNELRGHSSFFKPPEGTVEQADHTKQTPSASPTLPEPPVRQDQGIVPEQTKALPPRHHDTVVSRNHDTIIETTRRAVKQLGKEAATHRFTVEEKKALKSIERDFEDKDMRTSENEITRISINYIIEDYKRSGDKSILVSGIDTT